MSDERITPSSAPDPSAAPEDRYDVTSSEAGVEPTRADLSSTGDEATLAGAHDRGADEGARDAAGDTQYGIGPFTIREVSLLGVWLVAFIVSFFSVWVEVPVSSVLIPFGSVWSSGIDWILTIGVPTVAVFLIVLRRFSPDGIRRVGSLAVDQFASVAFSVSAVVWLGMLWTNISRGVQTGIWLNSWVVWVEFFLMLAGVFLTALAPFIHPFDDDFRARPEVPAHRNARPVRAVLARPSAPRAAAAPAAAAPATAATPETDETAVFAPWESDQAIVAEQPAPSASQAFWALAPVEREVVDDNGMPMFTVGPTAWALVIEDRGDTFVVRHEDGRVGYLTDVSGVTRG